MSQQLLPIDGGVQEIVTSTSQTRLNVLSQQYITAKHLESRPTEWVPGGRPIYRRLPATGETYQIDFFNIDPSPNVVTGGIVQDIGYVFVPWGVLQSASGTLLVSSSGSKEDVLIKGGTIVWKYGNTEVLPTIINLPLIDAVSARYDLAYQLVYDDSPLQKLYEVEDFALTGFPLTITSSTDSILGWRNPAVNAFLNSSTLMWSNRDTYFPPYAQPTQSYVQWESDLAMAYSKVTLRCPPNTAYTGTAALSYYDGTVYTFVETVDFKVDSTGQYFEFNVSPRFQTGWQVTFSSLDVSVQSVLVSGVVTLLERQAAPSTRATLVMYPSGTLPKTVVNSQNEEVQASYCPLATIEVDFDYKITQLIDTRYIIQRDYTPVADWLTKPFDESLIDLYEQVEDYSNLWMAPTTCLKQEYLGLEEAKITLEV
jgi:hypothetical protein